MRVAYTKTIFCLGYRLLLPLGLVGLVLWLVPGLAFTKYRCEFVNLFCIYASEKTVIQVLLIRTEIKAHKFATFRPCHTDGKLPNSVSTPTTHYAL